MDLKYRGHDVELNPLSSTRLAAKNRLVRINNGETVTNSSHIIGAYLHIEITLHLIIKDSFRIGKISVS